MTRDEALRRAIEAAEAARLLAIGPGGYHVDQAQALAKVAMAWVRIARELRAVRLEQEHA